MKIQFVILVAFLISIAVSYLLTPLARNMAFKFNVLDRPNKRKVHIKPVPLLGGVAIYIAFFSALLFTTALTKQILGLFIGSTILLITGIIDDRQGMSPRTKLLAQLVAALIVTRLGIKTIFLPDYYLNFFVTCFWIVGITNAFNLLDNLNGLSAGLAAISAIFLCILGLHSGQTDLPILAIALTGSCIGFLRYNFPKASIFMGDAGSMFLGFILSSIAVLGNWKAVTVPFSLCIPILILAYPIFDTTLVVISRLLNKRPIYIGGKDHSSHRLAIIGLKRRKAVLFIFIVTFFLGLSGVLMSKVDYKAGIIVLASVFLGILIFGIRLGTVNVYRNNIKNGKMNFINPYAKEKLIKIFSEITTYSVYLIPFCLSISKALLETAISIAMISWIIQKLLKKEYKINHTPLNLPIIVFFMAVSLSLINTEFVGESLKDLFFKTGEYVFLFFIVVDTIDNKQKLNKVFISLAAASIVAGLAAALQPITKYDFIRWRLSFIEGKVAGPFGIPNTFAAWCITLLPIWLSLFLCDIKNKILKLFVGCLTILLLAAFFMSKVRGAHLALAGALFFFVILKGKNIKLMFTVMILPIIATLIANVFFLFSIAAYIQYKDRLSWWGTALNMIQTHPIIGVGANNFISVFPKYNLDPSSTPAYAHNCYLQLMAECGILGFLIFSWMIVILFKMGIANYIRIKDTVEGSLLLGVMVGIVAMLLHSFVDTNLYSLQLVILLWFLMGIVGSFSIIYIGRHKSAALDYSD